MKTTIAKFSNERLEQEIANIYTTYHELYPGRTLEEESDSNLGMLWAEFDYRFREGLIDRNPVTGNEYDPEDM